MAGAGRVIRSTTEVLRRAIEVHGILGWQRVTCTLVVLGLAPVRLPAADPSSPLELKKGNKNNQTE